jgi:hypothetical protein
VAVAVVGDAGEDSEAGRQCWPVAARQRTFNLPRANNCIGFLGMCYHRRYQAKTRTYKSPVSRFREAGLCHCRSLASTNCRHLLLILHFVLALEGIQMLSSCRTPFAHLYRSS